MPRKTVALTAAERKQIDTKFSLAPVRLAVDLAKKEKPLKRTKP